MLQVRQEGKRTMSFRHYILIYAEDDDNIYTHAIIHNNLWNLSLDIEQ